MKRSMDDTMDDTIKFESIYHIYKYADSVEVSHLYFEPIDDKLDMTLKTIETTSNTFLFWLIRKKPQEVLTFIEKYHNKININWQNSAGWTVLILCSRYGYTEIVKKLLTLFEDIDVNLLTQCRDTALMLAVSHSGYQSNIETVKELLKVKTIDVNIQDDEGHTALMMAIHDIQEKCQIALRNSLELAKSLPKEWCGFISTFETVKELLKMKTLKINMQNNVGNTALMIAVTYDDSTTVRELAKNKDLDINIINNNGCDALDLSIKRNYNELTKELLEYSGIDIESTYCNIITGSKNKAYYPVFEKVYERLEEYRIEFLYSFFSQYLDKHCIDFIVKYL